MRLSIDPKAASLMVAGVLCLAFGHSAVIPEPGSAAARSSETVDIERLDSISREMVDQLYARAAESGVKGLQTRYVRFEGMGWESPKGVIAGTSALGALLGKRVELALSRKSTVLSPEDSDRAKGFLGTIVRGSYRVGKAGVRVFLRMVDRNSGSVLSEVSRELGLSAFPGVAQTELMPPASGEAEALGALISRALGGSTSEFAFRVSTDQGDFGSYVEGENLTIILESEKDCYVRVYHISWEERVMTLIFPNRSEQDGILNAGEVRRVPGVSYDYAFEVAKPYGVDAIVAVASLEPFGDESSLRAGWSQGSASREETSSTGTDDEDTEWGDDDTSWDDEEWWGEDEDIDWVDDYVVESNIDEERVEEVMAKGLIITEKKKPASGGIEWEGDSPFPSPEVGSSRKGLARATCYFVTVKRVF